VDSGHAAGWLALYRLGGLDDQSTPLGRYCSSACAGGGALGDRAVEYLTAHNNAPRP
jgi:hypothetical protein